MESLSTNWTVMHGKILFAYSVNSLGDFITTRFVKTWEHTACLTVFHILSVAPFPWLASKYFQRTLIAGSNLVSF